MDTNQENQDEYNELEREVRKTRTEKIKRFLTNEWGAFKQDMQSYLQMFYKTKKTEEETQENYNMEETELPQQLQARNILPTSPSEPQVGYIRSTYNGHVKTTRLVGQYIDHPKKAEEVKSEPRCLPNEKNVINIVCCLPSEYDKLTKRETKPENKRKSDIGNEYDANMSHI